MAGTTNDVDPLSCLSLKTKVTLLLLSCASRVTGSTSVSSVFGVDASRGRGLSHPMDLAGNEPPLLPRDESEIGRSTKPSA